MKTTYGVKGMTCDGCVGSVTRALEALTSGQIEFRLVKRRKSEE